jgi:hypothetical protein
MPHGVRAPSPAPGSAEAPIAHLSAAGAATGLLPFALAPLLDAATPSQLGPGLAALATPTRPATGRHAPDPSSPAHDVGGPGAPSAPPGSAIAGSAASAGSGLSSAEWCAILVCLVALSCNRLRRHRVRRAPPQPLGVTFLLQRPG